jgi:hypothetical protein
MFLNSSLRHSCVFFGATILLAGCGGGGGGGGGGSGGGASSLTLSMDTMPINFATTLGSTPPPAFISGTITGTGSGTVYILITSSAPNVAAVTDVIVGGNGGSASIVPSASSVLGLGVHTSTITVRACLNDANCNSNQIKGSPKTIAVSYTVTGFTSSADSLTYNIGNAAVAADYAKSLTIDSYATSGWNATVNVPLITLAPNSALSNGSGLLTATIDPSVLDDNEGGTYTGVIQLAGNTSSQPPIEIPVTVNITRTRVNFVAPSVAYTGRSAEVVIRGESFNAAQPTGVRFGNVDATAFNVVSDTEIRATHPVLAAGDYTVHVDNSAGVDRTNAVLHVIAPPAMATTTIAYPGGPDFSVLNMVYDAQRAALVIHGLYNAQGSSSTRLLRYAYAAGTWTLAAYVAANYNDAAIALSTDGGKLFYAHAGAFDELDPVTLTTVRSTPTDRIRSHAIKLAVANDGKVIIQTDYAQFSASDLALYSSLRRTVDTMLIPPPNLTIPPTTFSTGAVGASGDGSRVLMTHGYYGRTARYVGSTTPEWEDTDSDRKAFAQMSFNRRGTFLMDGIYNVYAANLTSLGNFPIDTISSALAPELPRAYTYHRDGRVRAFDLSVPAVNGELVEILPAISPASGDVYIGQMLVTPDGGVLFIGGYDEIKVYALP